MTNRPVSRDDLATLSARAVENARERTARVLDEAELEQAAGGLVAAATSIKLDIPIIFGLIFPDEVFKQSALAGKQVGL